MSDDTVLTCCLDSCGEEDEACRGFSLQEGPPHRVLWFCTKGCLVEHLIERGDVTDGFSTEWGRHW